MLELLDGSDWGVIGDVLVETLVNAKREEESVAVDTAESDKPAKGREG